MGIAERFGGHLVDRCNTPCGLFHRFFRSHQDPTAPAIPDVGAEDLCRRCTEMGVPGRASAGCREKRNEHHRSHEPSTASHCHAAHSASLVYAAAIHSGFIALRRRARRPRVLARAALDEDGNETRR